MIETKERIAVVLFNLGGPDGPKAVKPFLFNLFHDKAILRLPQPLRFFLAQLIASRRAPTAREIYAKLGGGSPIAELTQRQKEALEERIEGETDEYKVFTAMRYWHPFTKQAVKQVKAFNPDRIVLLPLYPQFSTTTTASSFKEWDKRAKAAGLKIPTTRICCYFKEPNFIAAHAGLIREAYFKASAEAKPRVLFSAHGLPQKIVDAGDPYPWQVEQTVKAIVSLLGIEELDYAVCYQSRVGRLEWIGPSTEEEIARAGADGVPLVVAPVAFVSEHSETLVELDIEYAHLAKEKGVPEYVRVPALGCDASFIEALSAFSRKAKTHGEGVWPASGNAICAPGNAACPCKQRGEMDAGLTSADPDFDMSLPGLRTASGGM